MFRRSWLIDVLRDETARWLLTAEGDPAAAGGSGAGAVDPDAKTGDAGAGGGAVLTGAAGGAKGDAAGATGTPVTPAWREDWREAMAGGDQKELARLKRFQSPDAVFQSFRQLEGRVSAGELKPVALPEKPSDAEIADYRKAHGIPDKPDYGLAFPDGRTVTEADKAELSAFQAKMHAQHMPPAAVKAAFQAFNELIEEAGQRMHDQLRELEVRAQATLRAEMGRDFVRNTALTSDFLGSAFAEANKGDVTLGPKIMEWRLADGSKLGDHPEFVRTMAHIALKYADEDALVAGSPDSGGKGLDERYKELIAKSGLGSLPKAEEEELVRLAEMKVAREERAGRRAAA